MILNSTIIGESAQPRMAEASCLNVSRPAQQKGFALRQIREHATFVRMSLSGGGPRGAGNPVTPIVPVYSLSFPKVPQGFLVPSPLEPPPLEDPVISPGLLLPFKPLSVHVPCQNYDPFLGTLNIRCRTITRTQKRNHNFDNHPNDGPK